MTIGWDTTMKPYAKPKEIPQTQIAIEANLVEGKRGRRLEEQLIESGQETWFEDIERNRMIRVMILEALEIKMKRETDSEMLSVSEEFKWDVIDYKEDFMSLQVEFENP